MLPCPLQFEPREYAMHHSYATRHPLAPQASLSKPSLTTHSILLINTLYNPSRDNFAISSTPYKRGDIGHNSIYWIHTFSTTSKNVQGFRPRRPLRYGLHRLGDQLCRRCKERGRPL